MRLLIDGYNLMHAQGLTGSNRDPERLRKARERLLKTLSKRLAPVDRHATRVVFDASMKLPNLPRMIWVDGITVEFASEQPTADTRICELISKHDAPKKLIVISSDNQIIQAAERRGCRVIGADPFMELLEDPRRPVLPSATPARGPTDLGVSPEFESTAIVPRETEFWLEEFADIVDDESIAEQLNADHTIIKSIDLREIEKEMRDLDPFDIRHKKR